MTVTSSSRKLAAALLLGASLLATGCASTATGMKQSSFGTGETESLRKSVPDGTVLAVVRYPAFVEASAEDKFAESYTARAIGGKRGGSDPVETRALADSMILKSNYFAMSLYRELAARLPEHSVLLSPHKVTLAADGSLTSEPMTQAESLPSLVAVDFSAYTYPDAKAMMGDKPLSFGDLVTPLVSVRTDPRANAATEGVLMASAPIAQSVAAQNYGLAIDDAQAMASGRIEAGVPELDLISHLSARPTFSVPLAGSGTAKKSGAVRAVPIEKISLNKNDLRNLSEDSRDILEAPFTDGFANQIIAMINSVDVEKATMVRRADAISGFDESLAALTVVGSDDPDYAARLRYAERLLEAEQKYLSVQSLRLYDGTVNGEMGAQVRDILKEEHRILERRRQLARQQNQAVAIGILSAVVAGATIATSDNNGRVSAGEQIAAQLAIQGAIFSATEAMRKNRLSKSVGSNYLQAVVPALNAQTEVQVDLIDSNETITAIRFEDLQAKLAELYARNQRSLDTIATQCAYEGPAGRGTWLGVCENGLANGTGVGVFRNAKGESVEHYGYARAGRADGPGYRIVRTSGGSYSLEGNFSAGEASGPIRKERAGQKPEVRRYQAGRDVGSAPSGSAVASPFNRPGAL